MMKMEKSKKSVKRLLALSTAMLMIFCVFQYGTNVSHAADTTVLQISRYVTTTGVVKGDKSSNKGTYEGNWNANIPIVKVLPDLEADMKSAADNNWYPHGKDGANRIAYVEYSVIFPDGVTIDNSKITMSNTTTMFNGAEFKREVNGQTVSFKFPLRDENWKAIYKYYTNDGGAASDKAININIPYTVSANSVDEARAAELKNIKAEGNFETHGSGTLYNFTKKVFSTDKASNSLAPEFSKSEVFAKPTVPTHTQLINLDADLRLGNDTGSDAITVDENADMNFVGVLDVKPIKNQMTSIEEQYQAVSKNIRLENLKTGFQAKLNLPEELKFAGDKEATLFGGNGTFQISKSTVSGQTLTVDFELVDSNNITTFKKLKEEINKVDDELKVAYKTVRFADNAKPNTDYTATGSVKGYLNTKAVNTESNNAINFNLSWNGKQSEAGKNKLSPNEISLSVRYKAPDLQDITKEGILYGDMLVNNDTQNKNVYIAKKDNSLTMTGLLDVTPIKDELSELEKKYPASEIPTNIAVSDIKTSFTATMTLPEQLDFMDNYSVELLGANDKFEITSHSIKGKTITVVMSVKGDVKTFKEVKEAVEGADAHLKVNVMGVMLNEKAKSDVNYTINGTISGTFSAKATHLKSGKTINFNYTWKGMQLKGGEDSTDPTTKDIKLTLKYNEPDKPDAPDNPKPDKPVKPNDSTETKPNNKVETKKEKVAPNTADDSGMTMIAGMAILSVLGLGFIEIKRKNSSIR
ncbi:MAG: hypothetical protein SPH92_01205 [Anaerovoracaceae bacterium]|nr:hypothetical protein [Anaerovoracaceae bacterium]